ncbi:glycosyl transferase [Pseudarthrobacter phenanthrenivorans Sphe3]|uniref:Glycosyl transferase n=1 Tax=Pseudarthrobacter phenanthrenivorans (strain DSM 18606 / JCM 16027 / LMG 23796 / Sphe3) TaxID=930171 RepID=F0MA45_PSEPM|nr:glycosyltransferase family A protein [Pseudarthrobacter phenanthrenivorans]ADX75032.1 glycosyl transferase [Pseudarthrobacter phenanthrenivorans Sphe3]
MFRRVRQGLGDRQPEVLVIVPCYNYGRYLESCVVSLLSQKGVSVRVHILDDASTDGSDEAAQAMADRDPRVQVTLHPSNRGHIATYNEGLVAADSDYVVLLSADDMLAPGALARATDLMGAFPSVGLVYGHPQAFESEPAPETGRLRNWSIWQGDRWIAAQCRRGLSIISSPEAVVRTSVQHRVGYYNPELPHSGDLEMWLRIADVSGVGRINGVDQAYRRVHPASMMSTNYGTLQADLEHRVRAYESFFAGTALGTTRSEQLRRVVIRRMAAEALEWSAASCQAGNVPVDEIDKAVSFALEIYPEAASSPAYMDYQYRSGSAGTPDLAMAVGAWRGSIQRDFGPRLRWRQWRRYGI